MSAFHSLVELCCYHCCSSNCDLVGDVIDFLTVLLLGIGASARCGVLRLL
jgi:hypothetical protein